MDDGHIGAKIHYIFHNVGGENYNHLLAYLSQEVVKAIALAGSRPAVGLVGNQQLRIANQCLGDAKALAHASREAGERFFANVIQVAALKHGSDHLLAFTGMGDAFEHGEVAEHILRRDARIHAEVLWQISKTAADLVFLPENINLTHEYASAIRLLKGCERSHESGFSCAVRPSRPYMPRGIVSEILSSAFTPFL